MRGMCRFEIHTRPREELPSDLKVMQRCSINVASMHSLLGELMKYLFIYWSFNYVIQLHYFRNPIISLNQSLEKWLTLSIFVKYIFRLHIVATGMFLGSDHSLFLGYFTAVYMYATTTFNSHHDKTFSYINHYFKVGTFNFITYGGWQILPFFFLKSSERVRNAQCTLFDNTSINSMLIENKKKPSQIESSILTFPLYSSVCSGTPYQNSCRKDTTWGIHNGKKYLRILHYLWLLHLAVMLTKENITKFYKFQSCNLNCVMEGL